MGVVCCGQRHQAILHTVHSHSVVRYLHKQTHTVKYIHIHADISTIQLHKVAYIPNSRHIQSNIVTYMSI